MHSSFAYDVFISYSANDFEIVRGIAERLRGAGLRVWCKGEQQGTEPAEGIEEGLQHSRVLVFCMSKSAFASDWDVLESQTLRFRDPREKHRRFIPLRLDSTPIQQSLKGYRYISWRASGRENAFKRLLELCRPPLQPEAVEMPTGQAQSFSQSRLFLPRDAQVSLPPSLFERRMSALSFSVPPQAGSLEAAHAERLMRMDIAFQSEMKALEARIPKLVRARMMGGSGLQLSKLLRSYFLEYADRLFTHGPQSLPSSFNVVESFMSFRRDDHLFDLREEVEHLLSLDDYFQWYQKAEIPRDPRLLEDILPEGEIFCYEMVGSPNSLRIVNESEQVFSAVAMVRHDYELSCLLLAGENPPLHSDRDVRGMERGQAFPGKKAIVADPSYTVQDRYLDGYPGFAKVIVLTRYNLRAGKHDVRYVNLDTGPSFQVFTDDMSIFRDMGQKFIEEHRASAVEQLTRYDDLFGALTSMIYLPAFFAAFPAATKDLEVSTELEAMLDDRDVKEAVAALEKEDCVLRRTIHCFPVAGDTGVRQASIRPPEMEFKTDGYWRPISPQDIGENKTGVPVVGRTWVSRLESWSAKSPESFTLHGRETKADGPDPGIIYVQRSTAMEPNLYKIGLTRRGSAQMRAGELSSATGVPLPFGVLVNWSVGDCGRVEREVHEKLAACRVNPRREFFYAEISEIVLAINEVIATASAQ